ncbi:MAG: AraC family transcriptional regulator [Flavobacteriales bacterium]|nr:AraC family transcriptional regulator [Flavobacteriales bacterium]
MVRYTKHADLEVFEGELSEHRYPWHYHACYTIIVVERGSVLYQFQDTSVHVGGSEVLVVEPFHVHRNMIAQPTTYSAIFVPHDRVERAGSAQLATQRSARPAVHQKAVALVQCIKEAASMNVVNERLAALCGSITDHLPGNETVVPSRTSRVPAIDLDRRITELAVEARLSKYHFQRSFKKKHGLTIGQLKRQANSEKAKALLELGGAPLDVAHEVGYFDQSHFIKYFKRMWAITPDRFSKG